MTPEAEATDSLIRIMPESLANKIAAGEVVQRPASVVKELVENALDAGARHITVILKDAGKTLVQVVDDGCGMSPADARLCFQRHATSKIRTIDDLERIHTLGFRGEALASIAAVARVELKTKRAQDAAGYRVQIEGGQLIAAEPCATANGTSVAVRNLFYNVPARRNFLKTPATEFKHIIETFQVLALSHPEVGFTLIHDDVEIYRLVPETDPSPAERLRRRIGTLFGPEYALQTIPVEETTSYLSVRGFLGRPELHRKSRGEQFFFVNRRYVRHRYLEHAVTSSYEHLIPEGAHPFFVLFLELDPKHVDVNVHPTKAEVKFDDERGIYGVLRAIVRRALGMADLVPQLESAAAVTVPSDVAQTAAAPRTEVSGATPLRMPPGEVSRRLYAVEPEMVEPIPQQTVLPSSVRPESDEETPEHDTLIWQVHDRYILTQIRSGLLLIDQNAAHERILYERALRNLESGFGLSQQLLFPQTLEFSPADFALIEELMPELRALGFDLELFSGRTVVVRGVPDDIRPGDERTMLEDLLAQYKANLPLRLPSRENLARSVARRNAIRPGTRLTEKQMRTLIDQLFLCETPYVSPTGRPTMIRLTLEELERRFGRA
ncbi:DNA mismatch repair endonuclease MutL [Rhodothermus marinus]|uniref:DNA mismatch repair protein MutL n=1 Tax=Rhodothermus marinus (strain ATCC 43812 / DSM 4252 / R-10) TaxID=518766 RepID=D0MH99_RHOM4|nr:DNA mismatch repair endonuclease MutL [Rhodothermus marinus]ACY47857.1 DNA mismatch repair protein MutL [Rhodothermus marinus DSM 4252]